MKIKAKSNVQIEDSDDIRFMKEALKQAAGANDLVDVQMDYALKTIFGINEVTVTLTATAVKY